MDDRQFNLPLSKVFWDIVLKRPVTRNSMLPLNAALCSPWDELEHQEKSYRRIKSNYNLTREQKEKEFSKLLIGNTGKLSDLCLSFVLPGHDNYDLIHNGSNTEVKYENLQDYINNLCYHFLLKSVKPQAEAFIQGFNQFFPIENMNCFKSYEIEQVFCGTDEEWDMEYLKANILPQHGYGSGSNNFLNFQKVLSEFDAKERRNFLMFTIGAPRLPIGGLKGLSPKQTIVKKIPDVTEHADELLPSVMTCQNYIKLPDYSDISIQKSKLVLAMNEGQEAFALS